MHYIRTVNMNDTGELYTYDLKEVEKLDETSFKITADGELFVTVDNEWHVSGLFSKVFWSVDLNSHNFLNFLQPSKVTVQVFRNAEGKEEFGESPYMSVQRKEICEFMQTTYKEKFYPFLEGCSNLPKPDECPINAVSISSSEKTKLTIFIHRESFGSKTAFSMERNILPWCRRGCTGWICLCHKITAKATSPKWESVFSHL